jgi:hypothetical protein
MDFDGLRRDKEFLRHLMIRRNFGEVPDGRGVVAVSRAV